MLPGLMSPETGGHRGGEAAQGGPWSSRGASLQNHLCSVLLAAPLLEICERKEKLDLQMISGEEILHGTMRKCCWRMLRSSCTSFLLGRDGTDVTGAAGATSASPRVCTPHKGPLKNRKLKDFASEPFLCASKQGRNPCLLRKSKEDQTQLQEY